MKRLYDEQVASQRQWEEAQTLAQAAQAQYQAALERQRLAEAGPRREELAVAEARVHEAESGLRAAEAAQLAQAGKQEELAAARAQHAGAQSVLRSTRKSWLFFSLAVAQAHTTLWPWRRALKSISSTGRGLARDDTPNGEKLLMPMRDTL